MKDQWHSTGKYYFFATAIVYGFLFVVSIIVTSHKKPVFTAQQIAENSNGIVLVIADDRSVPGSGLRRWPVAIGTGFWVNTNGYALTCLSPFQVPDKTNFNVIMPLFQMKNGKLMHVATAFDLTVAFPWCYDSETGMELLWVANSNFQRTNHLIAGVKDGKTGAIDGVTDRNNVPEICKTALSPGDKIYLVCIDSEGLLEMNMSVKEGRVQRFGTDVLANKHFLRIHTSIPFKPDYHGAPILNESGEVVGVVADSKSDTVAIPVGYILEMLEESKMKHINEIEPKGPPVLIVKPVLEFLYSSNSPAPAK